MNIRTHANSDNIKLIEIKGTWYPILKQDCEKEEAEEIKKRFEALGAEVLII